MWYINSFAYTVCPSREEEHKNKAAAPKKSDTQHGDGGRSGKPPAKEQKGAFFLYGGSSYLFNVEETFWSSVFSF